MITISKEAASKIAVDFLKNKKNTEKINVSEVEDKNQEVIVRGTCPIDLEGHSWVERFEVVMDKKGKIKSTDFGLL